MQPGRRGAVAISLAKKPIKVCCNKLFKRLQMKKYPFASVMLSMTDRDCLAKYSLQVYGCAHRKITAIFVCPKVFGRSPVSQRKYLMKKDHPQ